MAWLLALPCAAQCIVQEITAPPGGPAQNNFGVVASAGDVLAVGDWPGPTEVPRVYVYRRINDVWTYETTLFDPDAGKETGFYLPATNGEVILVGAPTADGAVPFIGAVHVWRYDGSKWVYETRLYPEGKPAFTFGVSLDIDGDVAVIGAQDDIVDGFSQAGSAFVFRYDRASKRWREEQKLYAFTPNTFELFGRSSAIKGNLVIIGANGVDQGRGAAYVFRHNGDQWIGAAELSAFDGHPDDRLGWSVYAGMDKAAAGAINAATAYHPDGGAAYCFVEEVDGWQFESKLVATNPSKPSINFGGLINATSDDNVLLVSAWDSFGAPYAGAVFLHQRIAGRWIPSGKIGDPNPNQLASFGDATAPNGDQVIVGATNGAGGGVGSVFIFNGIHQRDCDENGVIDACESIRGPEWPVTPLTCETLADFDGDGFIDTSDVFLLLAEWGFCASSCAADLDADGDIDGFDLAYLLSYWGEVTLQ